MMRLVRMNEDNAMSASRRILAAYPSLKLAQKEFRDRVAADELRLADYRSPSFDRVTSSGMVKGGFSLVNLQRKDIDEECLHTCSNLIAWDLTLIRSIPKTEAWMVPLLLKIYFGRAGMKRVTAEYGLDYQSFRAVEGKALHQALFTNSGENVENYNRMRDLAAKHGILSLIEERIK